MTNQFEPFPMNNENNKQTSATEMARNGHSARANPSNAAFIVGNQAPMNPWDMAKRIKVFRGAAGYPVADLEPGVKFFVLMLEQLGAITHYSCEGHPEDFYVMFSCSYDTALNISKCGFFEVEIFKRDTWTMRLPESPQPRSQRDKARTLRWAAISWEAELGALKALL